MSQLFINVTSISLPDPYDQVAMEGTVKLEGTGPAGGYSWAAYGAVSASQNDIKAACVTAAETVATAHSWSYSGAIIVGWPDEAGAIDDSGYCMVPGAGASITPALSTPRRPSTTRPTRVTVYGNIALTSTLLGSQTATATLKSDSSATPTTAVGVATYTLSGVVATSVPPFTLTYDVPVGHYYQVVASGAGSAGVSLAHVNEQVI